MRERAWQPIGHAYTPLKERRWKRLAVEENKLFQFIEVADYLTEIRNRRISMVCTTTDALAQAMTVRQMRPINAGRERQFYGCTATPAGIFHHATVLRTAPPCFQAGLQMEVRRTLLQEAAGAVAVSSFAAAAKQKPVAFDVQFPNRGHHLSRLSERTWSKATSL